MTVRLKNEKRYSPKDGDEVKCEIHNVVTTWGALDAIQQLAVENGLDTVADAECLLAPSHRR